MTREAIKEWAGCLYDGGWRQTDKEELKREYELTEEEAERICEELKEYEKEVA